MFAGGGALPGTCGPPLSAHCTLMSGQPRKAKSAADIKSLMQHECGPARTSRSMLPMTVGAAAAAAVAERRVSCAAGVSSSFSGYGASIGGGGGGGGSGGGGGGGGYGSLMVSAVKERRSCSLFPSPASAGTVAEKRLFLSSSSTTTPPAPCLCDVPFGGQSSSSTSWASAKRDFLMTPSTSLGGGTGFNGGSGGGRRTSCGMDHLCPTSITLKDRRPSFNNVIAQVTAERRPSSSMLRISNV